ncbi:MAG: ankyrin repeat domain-containing protein, partial [Dolichospermum sp.]
MIENTENKDTTLLRAVKSGNIQKVSALLACGANVDTTDHHGNTVLMLAANLGYTEIGRSLLNAGANINLKSQRYQLTALMLSASANQIDVVKLLISRGANVNATNEDGSTALMIASLKGYVEI